MKMIHSVGHSPLLVQENQDRLLDEKIKDIQTDRTLRIVFAFAICAGVFLYIYHVIGILYAQGEFNMFVLDNSVLITLLTTTTANVIALLVIVAKYLFPNK